MPETMQQLSEVREHKRSRCCKNKRNGIAPRR